MIFSSIEREVKRRVDWKIILYLVLRFLGYNIFYDPILDLFDPPIEPMDGDEIPGGPGPGP